MSVQATYGTGADLLPGPACAGTWHGGSLQTRLTVKVDDMRYGAGKVFTLSATSDAVAEDVLL